MHQKKKLKLQNIFEETVEFQKSIQDWVFAIVYSYQKNVWDYACQSLVCLCVILSY